MLNALLVTAMVFASVGLMLYLITLLFNAANRPLSGLVERWRIARCVGRARRCDALLERGEAEPALRELRRAFYLYPVHDHGCGRAVADLHTGLLSRLITLTADAHGGSVRLLSLVKVDRLLSERAELQKSYLAVYQSGSPHRTAAVYQQLLGNRGELDGALHQLMAEVRAARQPPRAH